MGGGGVDGQNDFDADWDSSYDRWGHPLGQLNYMDNNSSSIEIEFGDIENWHASIKIGNYLVNRSVANEYRDSARSGDCDFPIRSRQQTRYGAMEI